MNIEILLSMAGEVLDAEADYLKTVRGIRTKHGLHPKGTIWIPSLSGSDAYDLGQKSECADQRRWFLVQMCRAEEIDYDRLIALTKSIARWQAHNGLYDRLVDLDNKKVNARVEQYLKTTSGDEKFFRSTGRMKPWCKEEKN